MTTNKTPKKFYAILVESGKNFDNSYLDGPWRTLEETKEAAHPGEKIVQVKVVKPPKRKGA